MPTVDELGRDALKALAARHSPAELARAEAEALAARAALAKGDFDILAEHSAALARQARDALGKPGAHALFERAKVMHGAARTAFLVYRRRRLAADRAARAAQAAARGASR